MKVFTRHQGYDHTYTIKKFSHMTAATCKFTIEKDGEKRETTVKDYFSANYRINLRYPQAPLMETAEEDLRAHRAAPNQAQPALQPPALALPDLQHDQGGVRVRR